MNTYPDPTDNDLDDDHPFWLINSQLVDLFQGLAAPEDHENIISFLLNTGLPENTVRKMHEAMATFHQRSGGTERRRAEQWRTLALQFDRHRMAAMSHLRTLLDNPEAHTAAARAFLDEPPPPAPATEQTEPVAQTSAEWERRFLAHAPSSDPAEAECDIPPHGWRCTRTKGHDGPCAAVAAPDDVALVRRSMARLAAAEQAEPVVGFRLLPSRLTNAMRAAMADAARAYMARTGGNSPDAMYDAAVAAAPPAPAAAEPTWPEWAEQILKTVREYSGYDGYDDADGVDLHEEVCEALAELTAQIERLEAKAPAPARQEPQAVEQGESKEWCDQAKGTLDRLAMFLQAINAPHAVDWREWITSAENMIADERAARQEWQCIGYMSPKQVERIVDQEDASGTYIPMRKTPAGLFTLALYAAPISAALAEPEAEGGQQ